MNETMTYPQEYMQEIRRSPSVCIVIQFEPQINTKGKIASRLQIILSEVESRLLQKYSASKALPVISTLQQLIAGINYSSYKKSIAILASAFSATVLYLDFPVHETIRVHDYPDIKDVIQARQESREYLALVFGSDAAVVYSGTPSNLLCIKYNSYPGDLKRKLLQPDRNSHVMGGISSAADWDDFLRAVDQGLAILQRAYPLPVIVLGNKQAIEKFGQLTANDDTIISYLHCSVEANAENAIRTSIQPVLEAWDQHKLQYLLQKIRKAAKDGRLSAGIKEVGHAATHKRPRLLLVEQDFHYHDSSPAKQALLAAGLLHEDSYGLKDSVATIIEKVLKDNGSIELVPPGSLIAYQHIALIECHGDDLHYT